MILYSSVKTLSQCKGEERFSAKRKAGTKTPKLVRTWHVWNQVKASRLEEESDGWRIKGRG